MLLGVDVDPRRVELLLRRERLTCPFLHAKLADEEQLRGEFARVHVCRRFAMPI
jgi:hypothetical protein